MVKALLIGSLVALIAALGASVVWFRDRLPPDCRHPDTVALVRKSLVADFHLPPGVNLAYIRTVAGGFLAMRFVCQAEIADLDPQAISPGKPIPGWVNYISQLTPDRRRHEVKVSLLPLLKWEPVQ